MNPEKALSQNKNRFWGIYEAIVRQNTDPENRGRVRVENKFFYGNELSPWAPVAFLYGGKQNLGNVFIPELGSGVYIQFKNGIPSEPIVTGTWFAKPKGMTELPEECKGKPNVKVIKTKKFSIILDDDTGLITIKSNDGKISLETNSCSIKIDDSEQYQRLKISSEKCSIILDDSPGNAHKIILNGNASSTI